MVKKYPSDHFVLLLRISSPDCFAARDHGLETILRSVVCNWQWHHITSCSKLKSRFSFLPLRPFMTCLPRFLWLGKANSFLEIGDISQKDFILYFISTGVWLLSKYQNLPEKWSYRSEVSVGIMKVQFFGYCFGEEPCSCCFLVPKALRDGINYTHLSVFLLLTHSSWPFSSPDPFVSYHSL